MQDAEEFLTAAEVARQLRVSTRTVNRWARDNLIEGLVTPGGRRRFRRSQIEKFLTDQGSAA